MRIVSTLLVFTLAGWVVAQPPKATQIVIQPRGSAPTPTVQAPAPAKEKPGYIVIRPQKERIAERQLETDPPAAKPSVTPPAPAVPSVPVPVAKPVPASEAAKEKPDAKDTTNGKLVLETWDTAFLKGLRVGYYRVTIREHEKNGQSYLHATREQRLTVGRFGQRVEIWSEDSSTEKPDGTVLAVRMRQGLSKDQVLGISGHVEGDKLKVQGEGAAAGARNEIPWSDDVLGIARESTLYRDRKPKPGDSFQYRFYLGQTNRVMTVTVTAKAIENVAIIEGQPARKMLRLEAVTETLKDPNGKVLFKMSPATIWCDAETYEPLRTDQDMPGLGGRLTILRTSKEVSLLPPGKVPDLFDVQSIRLDRTVQDIHSQSSIVYRLTLSGDPEAAETFSSDTRQTITKIAGKGDVFDLSVTAVREPVGNLPRPGDEFLTNNVFLDSTDARVVQHAQSAIRGLPASASDWEKAQAVERWVHNQMRSVEFSQAMATAGEVARTLSGDCTEYAMLSAAMCRALGIPSRTALGLVYAPGSNGQPVLAYHMWFEVFANGAWVALDSTLGRGSIGPGHLKITDASWHKELSFAPLLPVLRVLNSEPKVEVIRVQR